MLLAGSFSEYPLFWLLEILLHNRETGLLKVSATSQSGHFFIKNGQFKDGEFGKKTGAAAVELASTFVDASFQFRRLDSTEYARLVWEISIGTVDGAGTHFIGADAFRTVLQQVLSYPEAAYAMLEKVVMWLTLRAMPQLLRFALAAYRRGERSGISIVRRTLAYGRAGDFSIKDRVTKKLALALRQVRAAWQIAMRCNKAIVKQARALNLQRGLDLVWLRRPSLPSLRAIATRSMQQLLSYVATVRRDSENARDLLDTQTRAYFSAVSEFLHEFQMKEKLLLGFRRLTAEWQIALGHTKAIIFKGVHSVNFQGLVGRVGEKKIAAIGSVNCQQSNAQFVLYAAVTGRNSANARISRALQTQAYAKAASEFARRMRLREKLVSAYRTVEKAWHIGLRGIKAINFKSIRPPRFRFGLALLRKKAANLPSLEQVVQSDLSFGVVLALLLSIATLCISILLRSEPRNGIFGISEESIEAQPQAPPRPVLAQPLGRRKQKHRRQARTRKTAKDMATIVE